MSSSYRVEIDDLRRDVRRLENITGELNESRKETVKDIVSIRSGIRKILIPSTFHLFLSILSILPIIAGSILLFSLSMKTMESKDFGLCILALILLIVAVPFCLFIPKDLSNYK